ncbi:MAG: Cell division protein FtsQ, partial [Dehalococcoidia bacterium]|nr:Cell division protein FtsQ [Dehalococcoidia bacterium]
VSLPSVTDEHGEAPRIGGVVDTDATSLVLNLAQALPQETGAQPKEFRYISQDGVTVLTNKGWSASFGRSNDLGYKMAVLRAVLPEATKACPQGRHVDLRYGSRPFFKCA